MRVLISTLARTKCLLGFYYTWLLTAWLWETRPLPHAHKSSNEKNYIEICSTRQSTVFTMKNNCYMYICLIFVYVIFNVEANKTFRNVHVCKYIFVWFRKPISSYIVKFWVTFYVFLMRILFMAEFYTCVENNVFIATYKVSKSFLCVFFHSVLNPRTKISLNE